MLKEQLAVIVADARAATDDLLELGHRVDDPHQHDVLHGRSIDAGGEQLRRGQDDRRAAFQVLEVAEMAAPDVAFVGRDPANVVGMVADEIGIQVVQCPPHFVGVFLIDAEHDGLGEPIGALQVLGQVPGNGFGSGLAAKQSARNRWCGIPRRESRGRSDPGRPGSVASRRRPRS